MKEIILSEEAYEKIHDRLKAIEGTLKLKQHDNRNLFLDNQEFLQVMNISKRTAQTWRDSGLIAYAQIGSKIYYKMADILDLLDKHHKPAVK